MYRSVGRSVCLSVCPYVFFRTLAVVDTKLRCVGMCNGCSAQQESGAALSNNSVFMGEVKVECGFLVKGESGVYQTWICG